MMPFSVTQGSNTWVSDGTRLNDLAFYQLLGYSLSTSWFFLPQTFPMELITILHNSILYLMSTHSLDFVLKTRLLNSLDWIRPPVEYSQSKLHHSSVELPHCSFTCFDLIIWFMSMLCRLKDIRGQRLSLFVPSNTISIKMN